jgi:hypothetical protein
VTPPRASDFRAVVTCLVGHDVEFILVGGMAAILEGAPVSTFDVDIVHRREPENLAKLLAALSEMDAIYRDPAGRTIRPAATNLAGTGHHLLVGRFGPVDVLGHIGHGLDFEALLPRTHDVTAAGLRFRVLDLEALIEVKEQVGHLKDLAVLPLLRRTLELRRQRGE